MYRKRGNASVQVERTTLHVGDDAGRIAMIEKRTIGTAALDNGTDPLLKRFIYSNHLQSAALELDHTGAILSYEEYHPYGTTAYQATNSAIKAVAKRYRFTGKERDEESGLNYHSARYYIPWLCRWAAVDPLESKYAGWSSYCYLTCDPVNDTDSTGMGGDNDDWHPPMAAPASQPNSTSSLSGLMIGYQLEGVTVTGYKDRGPGEYHFTMTMNSEGGADLKLESFRNKNNHSWLWGLINFDTEILSKRYLVDAVDMPFVEGSSLEDMRVTTDTRRYHIGYPQTGEGYSNAWMADDFENNYLKAEGSALKFTGCVN